MWICLQFRKPWRAQETWTLCLLGMIPISLFYCAITQKWMPILFVFFFQPEPIQQDGGSGRWMCWRRSLVKTCATTFCSSTQSLVWYNFSRPWNWQRGLSEKVPCQPSLPRSGTSVQHHICLQEGCCGSRWKGTGLSLQWEIWRRPWFSKMLMLLWKSGHLASSATEVASYISSSNVSQLTCLLSRPKVEGSWWNHVNRRMWMEGLWWIVSSCHDPPTYSTWSLPSRNQV